MKKFSTAALCLLGGIGPVCFYASCREAATSEAGEYYNIRNDVFWDTAEGAPLYSQGGGRLRAGFDISGGVGAYCHVDDVTLTRMDD